MTAISASTSRCKTLADGTLQVVINIEPKYAISAFTLFGSPGSACAIARLTNEAAVEEMRQLDHIEEPFEMVEKKGGALAKLAGQLCQQESFQNWIGVGNAEWAAESIRSMCGISSRAELDHNEDAANLFHKKIRIPYSQMMQRRAA